MIWKGCLQILVMLGIFFGILYGLYLLITPDNRPGPLHSQVLIDEALYQELLSHKSEPLNNLLEHLSNPTIGQNHTTLITKLEAQDVLAFLCQRYLDPPLTSESLNIDGLFGLGISDGGQLVNILSVSDELGDHSLLSAYLTRDSRLLNPADDEEIFWKNSRICFIDKYFNLDHLSVAIQGANASNTYENLKEWGIISERSQFRDPGMPMAFGLATLDNLLSDLSNHRAVIRKLYFSMANESRSDEEKGTAIRYLFDKITPNEPGFVDSLFVEAISQSTDDDLTTFLSGTDYVENQWGGLYQTYHSEVLGKMSSAAREAMIAVFESGFLSPFESQVIDDLIVADISNDEYTLSYYSDLISDDPYDASSYLERGKLLADEFNDQSGAIEDFTMAISLDETLVDAYFNRSLSREKINDIEGSIADYDQVIAYEPDNKYAMGNRAIMKHQLGDYPGAIADFTQTLAIDSDYIDAYYGRGLSHSMNGDTTGALSDYDAAINIDPTYEDAYINRAVIYLELDRNPDALADYAEVLKNDPANIQALYGMAYTYYELDSLDWSEKYYTTVTVEYPDEVDAFFSLGIVYNQKEDYQSAYNFLTKAIFMDAENEDAYLQRGWSSLNSQDTLNACLDWVEAADRGSTQANDYLIQFCKN